MCSVGLIYKGKCSHFPPHIVFSCSELGLLPVLPGNGILGSNGGQEEGNRWGLGSPPLSCHGGFLLISSVYLAST